MVLAQLELSFWDAQPAIAGAIQVGSDPSRRQPTAPAGRRAPPARSTYPPAPAGCARLGLPGLDQHQYACADDLVLSVITGSEPGAGSGAGANRPLLQVCV